MKQTSTERTKFKVAVGRSRFDTQWKNKEFTWAEMVERLGSCTRTQEEQAQYFRMSKVEQDKIKDVGGFVAGVLTGGRRRSDAVASRSMLTLDADHASETLWDEIMDEIGCACAMYTTHKHTPDKPRFRVIIPLSRDVTGEEYEAVARRVASRFGMDYFDDTTYQPARLMYFASASRDGVFLSESVDGDLLDPDEILAEYDDWHDISQWAVSSRVDALQRRSASEQGDPRQKHGIVGEFCRTYDVPEAIERFLPGVYTDAGNGRYTYAAGSTAAGLVLYQDGMFAYSNHSTDPASGRLCNAFDLVRLHMFADRDSKAAPGTPIEKMPSHLAMAEVAARDTGVRKLITAETVSSARDDFSAAVVTEDLELELLKTGAVAPTIRNVTILLRLDSAFNSVRFNQLSGAIECDDTLPWGHEGIQWKDSDDVQLRAYLENKGKFVRQTVADGLDKLAHDRAYHPIREYLKGLPAWDGVPRVDTLLIDYLGAEDCSYVRAVTRKTLCAAVRRVRRPGAKFDTILVLNGRQGIGKSTIVQKLAGAWFNDNLSLADAASKTGAEKIQGYWILEIGELAGMRKTDIESLRSFISRQDDIYREAYARRVQSHKRQCIFVGTTNAQEDGYLRDMQGNRRFWDVAVTGESEWKPWDMIDEDIEQIWAEVLQLEPKEDLSLAGEDLEEAERRQLEAIEADPRTGAVMEYLDVKLPADWYELSCSERRDWMRMDADGISAKGELVRERVSRIEIWTECFGRDPGSMSRRDSFELSAIMQKLPGWKLEEKQSRVPGYGKQRTYRRA